MSAIWGRIGFSFRHMRRAWCFRPLAVALAILAALPELPHIGSASNEQSAPPFSAFAQNTGCPTSINQIIQTACNTPVIAQFEQAAVQSYLAIHNIPVTDAPLIYQFGRQEMRDEIRAHMLELILSYAASDFAKLDYTQQNAYYWLQGLVQTEEKLYWAAANTEYQLWKKSPCLYTLDKDVATAQGLQYDSAQWCNPNITNYFATPPVPTLNYFLAVAWKKTYGSLVSNPTATAALFDTQQQAARYGALYALPLTVATAAALGGTVASNVNSIFPFAFREVYQSARAGSKLALQFVKSSQTSYVTAGADASAEAVEAAAEAVPAVEAAEASATAAAAGTEAVGTGVGFITGASVASVVAVAIFAIETAVEAGIAAVNTQNTLDELATLPALAAQAAQTPINLANFLGTSDGYVKTASAFISATLPEFQSTIGAEQMQNGGLFYLPQSSFPTPTVTYLDSSNHAAYMALRGGFFILKPFGATNLQPVSSQRFATRVGPYQFLVYRPSPFSTDVLCPGSSANNGLSPGAVPSQCYAYVTNALQMKDAGGSNFTVQIITTPTMTSDASTDFTPGTYKSFPVTFSPTASGIPCSVSNSGSLPAGIYFDASARTFSGNTVPQSAGAYNEKLTVVCGGGDGLGASFNFLLRVPSSNYLAITSSSDIYGTVGVPENFRITTSGSPTPQLSLSSLPQGWTFSDNHDGTATIGGTTLLYGSGCLEFGTQNCNKITATNGLETVSQLLSFHIVDYPDPLTFTSPASGGTLTFAVGTYTSYTLVTKGGRAGSIAIQIGAVAGFTLPSWLTVKDNGNGTAEISGTAPFSSAGVTVPANAAAVWCCGFSRALSFTLSVVNAQPSVSVASGSSLAFLSGTPALVGLTTNVPVGAGQISLAGPLPQGLSFGVTQLISVQCLTTTCPITAAIGGTPAVGSGGAYKIKFQISGPTGTATQALDLVIYEKPALTSSNRIVFYTNTPATAVLSGSGFPLTSIGPFQDGIGYSAGLAFSPSAALPAFLKLVSGLNGSLNGTARLTSSATAADIRIHPITVMLQGNAAAQPAFPSLGSLLRNTASINVYVVPPGDANLDFKTDCGDLDAVKAAFGKVRGAPGYDAAIDLNGDGIINVKDLALVSSKLPASTKCN